MQLRLTIVEGPRRGEEFVIKDDIVIGRSGGDLRLKDNKASKIHAKITIEADGVAAIEDLVSANGTILNGERVHKSPIKPGDVITIGKTKIRVEEYATAETTSTQIERGSWQYDVDEALGAALKTAEASKELNNTSSPFNPLISLEFIKGTQLGTKHFYSFGPRKLGSACADALIFEPNCPEIAFELIPTSAGGCQIVANSEVIRVNGLETQRQSLQNGDEISIGRTVIKLRVIKDP